MGGGAVKERGGKLWENGERCGGGGRGSRYVTLRWVTQRGRRFHPSSGRVTLHKSPRKRPFFFVCLPPTFYFFYGRLIIRCDRTC